MILRFSVSGFRSIVNEVDLDMTSRSLKTVLPRSGQTWADCSEQVAAIYGPNAAGKTTVLNAIQALPQAVARGDSRALFQPPMGRSIGDVETRYKLDFVGSDGVRYLYQVVAKAWGIAYEALYSYPHRTRRMLFTRRQDGRGADIDFVKGSSLTGPTAEVLKITTAPALYLAVARKYGHRQLQPIAQSIAMRTGVESVSFRDAEDRDVIKRVVAEMLAAPEEQGDMVRALIEAADLGLKDIDIRKEQIPEQALRGLERFAEAIRASNPDIDVADIPRLRDEIVFKHAGEDGTEFELPIQAQSSGTLTWLTIAWHALNALRNGTILLVDELDASLHPELARYIVTLFANEHLNVKGAQLIFSTHDVSLLSNSPMRILEPRNVWFVEKDRSGGTEMFSLDDFDNRQGNNNERRYLAGQFGAIPELDDSLLYEFITTPSDDTGRAEEMRAREPNVRSAPRRQRSSS